MYLTIKLPGGSRHQIVGAMAGYSPPLSGFVPILLTRAYDSRFDMSPDLGGELPVSSERSFSIATGRSVRSGEATEGEAVLPAGTGQAESHVECVTCSQQPTESVTFHDHEFRPQWCVPE